MVMVGDMNSPQEESLRLETAWARFSILIKRHEELAVRLSRDSDKVIYERLQKEFEAARASQTQEILLNSDEWNDGLLATVTEQVRMETDRKALSGDARMHIEQDLRNSLIMLENFCKRTLTGGEQVHLIKELYKDKVSDLYHSLPYHMVEFLVEDPLCLANEDCFIRNRSNKEEKAAYPLNVHLTIHLTTYCAFAETVLTIPQYLEQDCLE